MIGAESPERVAQHLVRALTSTEGLNEFFEKAIPLLAESFGADRVVLVDYRESTARFEVLYFTGYSRKGRFELQRRLAEMDLQRALTQKEPFGGSGEAHLLYVPLYFTTVLEALIIFESHKPIEMTAARHEVAKVASRLLGLLMSSNRLSINQTGLVDVNDLQRARQIQLAYLPPDNVETDRYEIYGYNRSSAIVGGDYFDYFRGRDNSIRCVLADASGHGLSAALIMSTFRGLLHAEIDEWDDCSKLYTALNKTVYCGSSIVQYLTSVFFDFDEKTRRLKYANAGHFEPAVVRSDGTVDRLHGGGPPLGMFGNSEYSAFESEVGGGDLLVLFTDGFTDLRNPADEYFGEERIFSSVRQHRTRPLKEIASVLLNEGMTFIETAQPEDDLTLFLVRFR